MNPQVGDLQEGRCGPVRVTSFRRGVDLTWTTTEPVEGPRTAHQQQVQDHEDRYRARSRQREADYEIMKHEMETQLLQQCTTSEMIDALIELYDKYLDKYY